MPNMSHILPHPASFNYASSSSPPASLLSGSPIPLEPSQEPLEAQESSLRQQQQPFPARMTSLSHSTVSSTGGTSHQTPASLLAPLWTTQPLSPRQQPQGPTYDLPPQSLSSTSHNIPTYQSSNTSSTGKVERRRTSSSDAPPSPTTRPGSPGRVRERRSSSGAGLAKVKQTVIGFAPRPAGGPSRSGSESSEGGDALTGQVSASVPFRDPFLDGERQRLASLVIPGSVPTQLRPPTFAPSRRDTPDLVLTSPISNNGDNDRRRSSQDDYLSPGSPYTPYLTMPFQTGGATPGVVDQDGYPFHPPTHHASPQKLREGRPADKGMGTQQEAEGQSDSVPPVSLLTALLQQHQQVLESSRGSTSATNNPGATPPLTSGSASASDSEPLGMSYRKHSAGSSIASVATIKAAVENAQAGGSAGSEKQGGTGHHPHVAAEPGLEAVPEGTEDDGEDEVIQVDTEFEATSATRAISVAMVTQVHTEDIRQGAASLSRQSSVTRSILIKEKALPITPQLPESKPDHETAPSTATSLSSPRARFVAQLAMGQAEQQSAPAPLTPAAKARTSSIKFAMAPPPTSGSAPPSRRTSMSQPQEPAAGLLRPSLAVQGDIERVSSDEGKSRVTRLVFADEPVHSLAADEEDEDEDGFSEPEEEDDDDEDEEEEEEEEEGVDGEDRIEQDQDEDEDDSDSHSYDSAGTNSGYEEDSEPGYSDDENVTFEAATYRRRSSRPDIMPGSGNETFKESRMVNPESPSLRKLEKAREQALELAGTALASACWARDRGPGAKKRPKFRLGASPFSRHDDDEDSAIGDEVEGKISPTRYPFARPTNYRRRRPESVTSMEIPADFKVEATASPSSYVKIDPKERTHRGRGTVSIVNAVPSERVDRNMCSRHSSPPPKHSRSGRSSRTSSSQGHSRSREEVPPPAAHSPSAIRMQAKRCSSASRERRPTKVSVGRRSKTVGSTSASEVPDLEGSSSVFLDEESTQAEETKTEPAHNGWRSDDAFFRAPVSRPVGRPTTPGLSEPSSRRPSVVSAQGARLVFRRASETLVSLTRIGLNGPVARRLDDAPASALRSDVESDSGRSAVPAIDKTPAFARMEGSSTAAPSADLALQKALTVGFGPDVREMSRRRSSQSAVEPGPATRPIRCTKRVPASPSR